MELVVKNGNIVETCDFNRVGFFKRDLAGLLNVDKVFKQNDCCYGARIGEIVYSFVIDNSNIVIEGNYFKLDMSNINNQAAMQEDLQDLKKIFKGIKTWADSYKKSYVIDIDLF